jgi:hypothetical protein
VGGGAKGRHEAQFGGARLPNGLEVFAERDVVSLREVVCWVERVPSRSQREPFVREVKGSRGLDGAHLWAEVTPWARVGERNGAARHFCRDSGNPLLTFLERSGASPHQTGRFPPATAVLRDQLAGSVR